MGCDPGYPELPVLVKGTPFCASIEVFGNGEPCDPAEDGSTSLEERCGLGGACASAGVCVSSAEVLACRCTEDEHCAGWQGYLDRALGVSEEESRGPVCFGGGCMVYPERLEENPDGETAALGDVD